MQGDDDRPDQASNGEAPNYELEDFGERPIEPLVQPIQHDHPKTTANEPQPQEKQAEDEFYGINKTLYRKVKKPTVDTPTFLSGTDNFFLPANPEFKQFSEKPFPVYEPEPFILEDSIKREVQRICFLDTLLNKIVYDIKEPPACTKDTDPTPYGVDILPYYLPQSASDTTLVFESRFESGNLRRAIQLLEFEYHLILKPDWNTTSHTQWFYFSVANTRKDVEYKFSIINMMKPDSLYNSGMRPLIYSEKQARMQKIGWYRDGSKICYYQNNLKRKNAGFYYTLNFSLKFPYDNDTIYIAHCYPYTYTQLQKYLGTLEGDQSLRNRIQRKTLCQTIAGNNCDYVIIGDFTNGKEKKGIFLTSRVHPGESMASFLIEYIIDFLVSNSPIAKILRENFIFKIVPMLNIDGVVNGNYRCNLACVDLNRQWIDPSKKFHPTIYHTKQLVKRMKEERDLMLYCDFHGHSRKKNAFIYGCAKDTSRKEQIFPGLMKNNCRVFSFKDCGFMLQKDREGAARIALWKELNIVNCFTLEMSFCGADFGSEEFKHFNLATYRNIAEGFCQSIYDCYEPEQTKVRQISEELEQNGLRLDRPNDDKCNNSDGDDTDYEQGENRQKEAPPLIPTNAPSNQFVDRQPQRASTLTKEDPMKNQLQIKKKINSSLPAKKKK